MATAVSRLEVKRLYRQLLRHGQLFADFNFRFLWDIVGFYLLPTINTPPFCCPQKVCRETCERRFQREEVPHWPRSDTRRVHLWQGTIADAAQTGTCYSYRIAVHCHSFSFISFLARPNWVRCLLSLNWSWKELTNIIYCASFFLSPVRMRRSARAENRVQSEYKTRTIAAEGGRSGLCWEDDAVLAASSVTDLY